MNLRIVLNVGRTTSSNFLINMLKIMDLVFGTSRLHYKTVYTVSGNFINNCPASLAYYVHMYIVHLEYCPYIVL